MHQPSKDNQIFVSVITHRTFDEKYELFVYKKKFPQVHVLLIKSCLMKFVGYAWSFIIATEVLRISKQQRAREPESASDIICTT